MPTALTKAVLADIPLAGGKCLRLRAMVDRDQMLLDLRVFDRTGHLQFPTAAGFAIDPEQINALRAALDHTIDAGLPSSPIT